MINIQILYCHCFWHPKIEIDTSTSKECEQCRQGVPQTRLIVTKIVLNKFIFSIHWLGNGSYQRLYVIFYICTYLFLNELMLGGGDNNWILEVWPNTTQLFTFSRLRQYMDGGLHHILKYISISIRWCNRPWKRF